MSHSVKQNNSLAGKFKGNHHGNLSPRIAGLISAIQPQGFKKVNHEIPKKPIIVQKASESKATSVVKHHSFSHGSGYSRVQVNFGKYNEQKKHGLLTANEKETMQKLNDRLASYLEKVRSLEQENARLEKKIREWCDTHRPQMLPDFSHYFATIEELQTKVLVATSENTRIARRVDNAHLAAGDFRNKCQMEQRLRNDVEFDVKNLRSELQDLQIEVQLLDNQNQNYQQDLLSMKKNNEDMVNSLRSQLGARVTVEVKAPPSMDLNKLLSDIREQYEELMENNKIEAEKWFIEKSAELKKQSDGSPEELPSLKSEMIELKRIVQTMEIDKQSQLSMNSALESTLTEKEASYSSQLSQLQAMIHEVEAKLSQIRDKQRQQGYDHEVLMDVTMHLEREITTYRRLLDEQDIRVPRPSVPGVEGHSKIVRVLSITEEVESRKILTPRDKC
ncbi:keratin, type I cytoskeletal 19-like [Spea bombifrons]|uniref:keratin, type I cytoskeletal 19-like n=1 Tax=Spea bombifrons TaxID=233779 RepID=UPI002349A066|nr:keratin, type I cytoskeletal 19-like [Spea bombifrons]